jgi:hypothetical protein
MIPSSTCPLWQSDQPGPHAGNCTVIHRASYTTPRDATQASGSNLLDTVLFIMVAGAMPYWSLLLCVLL